MEIILTTVGTSIITNYLDLPENEGSHLKKKWTEIKDRSYSDNDWLNLLEDYIQPLIDTITEWEQADSAEIKTLRLLQEKFGGVSTYLVTSDTIAGVLAGELLKDILPQKGISIQGNLKRIDKFDVLSKDRTKIKQGFNEYIKFLLKEVYVNAYNISGGYKAIIPITTLIASYKKLNLFYNFEFSDILIEIPPFPYDWDLNKFSIFERFLKKVEEGIDSNSPEYKSLISSLSPSQRELLNSIILIDSEGIITESEIGTIYREAYEANKEIVLQETSLKPEDKKLNLAEHGSMSYLMNFWNSKLRNSKYVVECICSIEYYPRSRKLINKIFDDGTIDIVLHKSLAKYGTDAGYAMKIKTTARNRKETEKIAEILTREYDI